MVQNSGRLRKTFKRNDHGRRTKKEKIRKQIQNQIKKIKKRQIGLNSREIEIILNTKSHFIGVFSEDELQNLVIQSFPCLLIANIDTRNMNGSHWIAIGIFRDYVEIFDPLGFNIFSWTRVPCFLLAFLHRLSIRRKVLVSKCLQSDQSLLCGIYCCLYVYLRSVHTWNFIQSRFVAEVEQNDKILPSLF